MLLEIGGSDRVVVLELDRYYRSQDLFTAEQRARLNYDHPDALEFELLVTQLTELRNGKAIDAPVYDFATHCRDPLRTTRIEPKHIIIVEGILVFANSELREIFDFKIFVDTPKDIRLARRIERDTRERGRSIESVNAQWQATVQPMHEAFCEPSRVYADVVVAGRDGVSAQVQSIWSDICKMANAS